MVPLMEGDLESWEGQESSWGEGGRGGLESSWSVRRKEKALRFSRASLCVEYQEQLRAGGHLRKEGMGMSFHPTRGSYKSDTGTFFQAHGEPSHKPTPQAPEALVWTKGKSPWPLPTFLLRAGSKGNQIGPGKGSGPAWRSPQELSWSPPAPLDTPQINKEKFRLAAKTHLRFKGRDCCSGEAGKLSAPQAPSLKSKP